MIRWFLLAIAVVLLSACIGIESDILIRQDGSGILTLSYTISQYINKIDAGRSEKMLPLPINEDEFRRTVEGIEGLRLTNISESADEENVYIEAELEFDSVEAVNAIGREGQIGISLEGQGDTNTFRQVIYEAPEGEAITADSLEMIETFFVGYELVYSISVPTEIQSHSLGELSTDSRTVRYTTTISELLKRSEPLVLEVIW